MNAATQGHVLGQDVGWMLDHWASAKPEHPLLVWAPRAGEGRTWTYAEFRTDVRRLAAGLAERGVGKGDHVLIHADNCPEAVLTWYACAVLGAVGVTTNTRCVAAELTFLIAKTQCVAAVTQPQFAELVRGAAPAIRFVAVTADNSGEPIATPVEGLAFADLFADEAGCPERPVEPMLPAGILFTSGTTSKPKAVVHTHANVVWAGRAGSRNVDLRGDDVYLMCLPFFHINAQSWCLWSVLGVGATAVLTPKWSTSRFWDTVTTHGVTHISLMMFSFEALLSPDRPEVHTLRVAVFAQILPELDKQFGISVYANFGMTETVTQAINGRPGGLVARGSMGFPSPGYEMAVMDETTLASVATGAVGELWLRGTRGVQLFLEYFDNPEANAASFTDDGWFRTGDLVSVAPGGNVVYADRHKDLIKVGGENVSALEVENVVRAVPGVAEVAVVARTHERLDMVAVAFVIPTPGAPDNLEKLVIDACATQLSNFKVPRAVYMVDAFPRATLDKVTKNELRDMAESMPAL